MAERDPEARGGGPRGAASAAARATAEDRIDWHEVARNPALARLGQSLRRQLNVWVGFVAPSGQIAPLGATQPVDKPLCDAFAGRRDAQGSCQASVRGWLEAVRSGALASGDGGPVQLGCHAGLRALVVPIRLAGAVVGAAYASGFLLESEAASEEAHGAIATRGKALGLSHSVIASGTRDVVRLSEREERLLGELLVGLAEGARDVLGEGPRPLKVRRRTSGVHDYRPIIGESPAMQALFRMLDKVVRSDSTVLIRGEPGVGKELVARAIHFNSARAEEPFVAQNCSAMNDSLLDSELFGHKRGSFTGAISDKQGLFELADRGTFFLDEIGDMSPMLQVKLLRVLQEGTFLPVGDTVVRKVDVRVVAATHRDLSRMIRENRFREDLFYRIAVIPVEVPPLRARREDIPLLLDHFLQAKSLANMLSPRVLSPAARAALIDYDWPGNVRELENEVERLVVLSGDQEAIPLELLSPRILGARGATTSPAAAASLAMAGLGSSLNLPDALEALERQMILDRLRLTGWNKTRTAKALGISRRNLIRKVDRYGLDELRPAGGATDPDDDLDDDDEG